MVILSSTFQGSPREMQQNYQDSMAIIAKFGKPNLFLTYTCNPKSHSITENLPLGVTAENRPDLVACVFKRQLLGKTVAMVYVTEFQKSSLPHCNILDQCSKLRDSHDIDDILSAETPDKKNEIKS